HRGASGRGRRRARAAAPAAHALRRRARGHRVQPDLMEERGYVAEALLERLRADGVAFRLIGDSSGFPESAPEELDIAVPREALGALPRRLARFAQDFDFRLVELYRPGRAAWRAVLAWTDEVGRPRFMAVRFFVGAEEGMS